jgi:hypothetical protein
VKNGGSLNERQSGANAAATLRRNGEIVGKQLRRSMQE